MGLRITIDIFSGRENPVIELTEGEAQEAIERLQPIRRIERGEMGLPSEPTLGYRGLIIEQTHEPVAGLPKVFRLAHGSMFGPRLAHRATDEAFEDFICGSTGPIRRLGLGDKFPAFVKKEINRFRDVRAALPGTSPILWPVKPKCPCAPLYEPKWWNDGGQRQLNNNCYN